VLCAGVAFSNDGALIAAATLGRVVLIYTATAQVMATIDGSGDVGRDVAFSADDKWIAIGNQDKTAWLIDVRAKTLVRRLPHGAVVMGVAFIPGSDLLATAAADTTLRFWDVATGRLEAALSPSIRNGTTALAGVSVSDDGRWLATSDGGGNNVGGIVLWDAKVRKESAVVISDRCWGAGAVFAPSSPRVYFSREDGAVATWDIEALSADSSATPAPAREATALLGQPLDKWAVAASPDGQYVAVGGYRRVDVFDVASERVVKTLDGFVDAVAAVAYSPDGKLLATGTASSYLLGYKARPRVTIWDTASWTSITTLSTQSVSCIAFSADGKRLVATAMPAQGLWGPGGVSVWNASDWSELPQFQERTLTGVNQAAFSPSGSLLVTAPDIWNHPYSAVSVWDVAKHQKIAGFQWRSGASAAAVAFVDGERTILSASSDRNVRLWDVDTGALKRTIAVTGEPTTVDLLDDKGRAAIGFSSGDIGIWETDNWQQVAQFHAHDVPVNGLALVPLRKVLVSVGGDRKGNGSVKFWHYAARDGIVAAPRSHIQSNLDLNETTEERLDFIRDMLDRGKIAQPMYYRVARLLRDDPDELDAYDRDSLAIVERAFNGQLDWGELESRLDAVEGMDLRNGRRWTEAAQRTKELRRKTIEALIAEAKELDNVEHGYEAIEKLKHVLCLDSEHAEAKQLLAKIEGYYPPKTQTNSLSMTLVEIRPGRFLMGSPLAESGRGPGELIHAVRITKEFWLGAQEVTRGQFAKFVEATGYRTDAEREASDEPKAATEVATPQPGAAVPQDGSAPAFAVRPTWRSPGFEQQDDHPAVHLSWKDAQAFCRWLSETEGKKYRLPTEAEWEYACRADGWTAWPWSDAADVGNGWCNVAGSEARGTLGEAAAFPFDDGAVQTNRVGAYRASKWGLFDMTGNVREWCHDYGGAYPALLVEDPRGPERGIARIIRGGSWRSSPAACRAAAREQNREVFSSDDLGFRIVME
jgi:sulfatase modifying factor 1